MEFHTSPSDAQATEISINMAVDFDTAMLVCHVCSCSQLFLYFAGLITASYGLTFELGLLAVKTSMEVHLNALTADLILHHGLMFVSASAALLRYPIAIPMVLFPQTIHLPLALQYTRRLSGGSRGCQLDICFAAAWLLVVTARSSALLTECINAYQNVLAGRWLLFVTTVALAAVDIQWTRETFEKRAAPPGTGLILACGVVTGWHHDSPPSRCIWAALCVATLLAAGVGWGGIPSRGERERLVKVG